MKKLLQYTLLITLICAFFTVSGCKSKQSTLKTSGKLEKKSLKSLLEGVKQNEISYSTLECKSKIELRTGSSGLKTNAVFKLVKDSMTQVSIRIPVLGGEAIRLSFSPNEITIIDRLHKQYAQINYKNTGDLNTLAKQFFYNSQALFTNQLFIPGKLIVNSKDYNAFMLRATPDFYLLQTQAPNKMFSVDFAVDASDRIASTLISNTNKSVTLHWSYQDFVVDSRNNAIYPTHMDAKIQIEKYKIDMGIVCPQIDIDSKNFSIDNSIPQKYTKVEIRDIINKYTDRLK